MYFAPDLPATTCTEMQQLSSLSGIYVMEVNTIQFENGQQRENNCSLQHPPVENDLNWLIFSN